MFTDRVKKVMQIAREESVRLGNDYVGTEHLLLGPRQGRRRRCRGGHAQHGC